MLALICICFSKNMKSQNKYDHACYERCAAERLRRGQGAITICGINKEDCCIDENLDRNYGECAKTVFSRNCRDGTFAFSC